MPASSKRLEYLLKITASGGGDPFPRYGLALEYRTLERYDEALDAFRNLREGNPDYVPMYLMCGQMLEKLGRKDEAREWLEAGIVQARAKRDSHALGELEGALSGLEE